MSAAPWFAPLARIPAGSSTPTWGVVLFAAVYLAVVIGFNTFWEIRRGPPNP